MTEVISHEYAGMKIASVKHISNENQVDVTNAVGLVNPKECNLAVHLMPVPTQTQATQTNTRYPAALRGMLGMSLSCCALGMLVILGMLMR